MATGPASAPMTPPGPFGKEAGLIVYSRLHSSTQQASISMKSAQPHSKRLCHRLCAHRGGCPVVLTGVSARWSVCCMAASWRTPTQCRNRRSQAATRAKNKTQMLRPTEKRLMSEIHAPIIPSQFDGDKWLPVVLQAESAGWWLIRVASQSVSRTNPNASSISWLKRLNTRDSKGFSAGLGAGTVPVRSR